MSTSTANRWRGRQALPATRVEADDLYRPRTANAASRPALSHRLYRLNALGLLELREKPTEPVTGMEAHEALLDFYWPPDAV